MNLPLSTKKSRAVDAPAQQDSSLASRVAPNYAWLVLGILTLVGYAINALLIPHAREGLSLPEFIMKIVIFLLAVASVACIPNWIRDSRLSILLLTLPTLAFLGYIIPRMYYWFLMGPDHEPAYYTLLWNLCFPAIVLASCLAFRMGGGTVGRTFKIGANALIVLFSGYLEFMWFVVNPLPYEAMATIPHIEVLIGFKPSHAGLIIFFICHIPLFVAVNLMPIDRWLSARSKKPPVAAKAA